MGAEPPLPGAETSLGWAPSLWAGWECPGVTVPVSDVPVLGAARVPGAHWLLGLRCWLWGVPEPSSHLLGSRPVQVHLQVTGSPPRRPCSWRRRCGPAACGTPGVSLSLCPLRQGRSPHRLEPVYQLGTERQRLSKQPRVGSEDGAREGQLISRGEAGPGAGPWVRAEPSRVLAGSLSWAKLQALGIWVPESWCRGGKRGPQRVGGIVLGRDLWALLSPGDSRWAVRPWGRGETPMLGWGLGAVQTADSPMGIPRSTPSG